MARTRTSSTNRDPVEASQIKSIKDKLNSLGGQGFHFRVKKRNPDKSFGYKGKLDAETEDIEEALKAKYNDGVYRLYAHFNNGKMIRDVPPIDFTIGNPETWVTADGRKTHPVSDRLRDIEEEIQAKRKQKDLLRAERELERMEREMNGEDDQTGGSNPLLESRLEEMSDLVEQLSQQNRALMEEKKKREFEDRLEKMQNSFDAKFEKLLAANSAPKIDPQIETLKLEIERLRSSKQDEELKALRDEIREAKKGEKLGVKEIAAITAPFVPILTTYIDNQKNASTAMIDSIAKIAPLVTAVVPKGMDWDNLLKAAPLIAKLIPKGPDMSGMFEMVGAMVGPVIEAAASGGGGGDGMADVVKQVLGAVQKAMAPQRQPTFRPQQMGYPTPPAPAAMMPTPPPAKTVPKPQAARKPRQPQTPSATPVIGMAKAFSGAIRRRDENIDKWVGKAERSLTPIEKSKIESLKNGAEFATYLCGQPGVDSTYLTTSYGKRWLGEFLRVFSAGSEEDQYQKAEAPVAAAPAPVVTPPVAPALAAPAAQAADSDPLAVFRANKVEKDPSQIISIPHDRTYPQDSIVAEIPGYDTVAGPIDLKVEIPTPEEVERREKERQEMVAKYQNEPEARIKIPQPVA